MSERERDIEDITEQDLLVIYKETADYWKENRANRTCFKNFGEKSFQIVEDYLLNKGLVDVNCLFANFPRFPQFDESVIIPLYHRAEINNLHRGMNSSEMVYVGGIHMKERTPLLIYSNSLRNEGEKRTLIKPLTRQLSKPQDYRQVPLS